MACEEMTNDELLEYFGYVSFYGGTEGDAAYDIARAEILKRMSNRVENALVD